MQEYASIFFLNFLYIAGSHCEAKVQKQKMVYKDI